MITLSSAAFLVLVIVLPVAGALAGYALYASRARLEAGGMSAAELRREYDAYRAQVDQHFHGTGALLGQLSVQYQAICEHMADGARTLGATPSPEIERLRAALQPPVEALAALEAPVLDAVQSADGEAMYVVADGQTAPEAAVAPETTTVPPPEAEASAAASTVQDEAPAVASDDSVNEAGADTDSSSEPPIVRAA